MFLTPLKRWEISESFFVYLFTQIDHVQNTCPKHMQLEFPLNNVIDSFG